METKTNKINLMATPIIALLLASIVIAAFATPSHASAAQSHKNTSNLKSKNNSNSHGSNQKTCGINSSKVKETKDDAKGIKNKETKEDGICG